MTPAELKEILKFPMDENDSGADTVGGYLKALLVTLWEEEESFSGKHPFGNSGWQNDLLKPLVVAGVIKGSIDPDGYADFTASQEKLGKQILVNLINSIEIT